MPTTKPELESANPEPALDAALRDTFPASDPPAATGFTPPTTAEAANEIDEVCAWLVLAAPCVDKPVEQWRTCGQGRWLSPNVPALIASLSPAGALLEALVNQHLEECRDEWKLVPLKLPGETLRRLDNPHELWRERPYRNEVRMCGDRWALEQQSLALRVPSALCPGEYNILINTLHPDFAKLSRGDAQPLEIDSRLR
ncbi:RES family NAD+ phosphorylase [Arenimonas composti]|nr:RES family NAD+ phosphorylase [Arenimonas composti]